MLNSRILLLDKACCRSSVWYYKSLSHLYTIDLQIGQATLTSKGLGTLQENNMLGAKRHSHILVTRATSLCCHGNGLPTTVGFSLLYIDVIPRSLENLTCLFR